MYSVEDLAERGRLMLCRYHVLASVYSTLREVQFEGYFPTGTHLVTIRSPISPDRDDLQLALYGSFLPVPDNGKFPLPPDSVYLLEKKPRAVVVLGGQIRLNGDQERRRLRVINRGDFTVLVGSNRQFTEANRCLEIDRIKAYGYRLDVAASTSVSFGAGNSSRRCKMLVLFTNQIRPPDFPTAISPARETHPGNWPIM
ncbi:hypothetical protein C2857_003586 [Epichloe festucae Fl1]|uniref:urease n=1 Tax=Epichloe festucae (strain Fl1) TaxID=877507 RepID=A0A7S9PWV4_EPIFF|nr:hypothetical protein C2857_003586 [Epichloe festucae Fl1]